MIKAEAEKSTPEVHELVFSVPIDGALFLSGKQPPSAPSFRFRHWGVEVVCDVVTDGEPFEIRPGEPKASWNQVIVSLRFRVERPLEAPELRGCLLPLDEAGFVDRLGRIANKAIETLRCFGRLPSLAAENVHSAPPAYFLRRWRPELLLKDGSRQLVGSVPPGSPPSYYGVLAGPSPYKGFWDLTSESAKDVQVAFDEGLKPEPFQDFALATLDHLSRGERRAAVLEAVIALELAVTSYIEHVLGRMDRLSKKQVTDAMSPEFDLGHRLILIQASASIASGLCDTTKVLEVVKWRNRIMHRSGRLPEQLPTDFDEHVTAVLAYASRLNERTQRARRSASIQGLPDCIRDMKGFSITGEKTGGHEVVIRCLVESGVEVTSESMGAIAARVADWLSSKDGYFVAKDHLTVTFESGRADNVFLPRTKIATWKGGSLSPEVIEQRFSTPGSSSQSSPGAYEWLRGFDRDKER